MKRLSQSGSSNFCPELRKHALLISQSYFRNFALHMIKNESARELAVIRSLLAILTCSLTTQATRSVFDLLPFFRREEIRFKMRITYFKKCQTSMEAVYYFSMAKQFVIYSWRNMKMPKVFCRRL